MNYSDIDKLKKLIKESQDQGIIEFGTPENAVEPFRYEIAEKKLNVKLPESYLWFLKNYGNGSIVGDEIYDICGEELEDIPGEDIVYMHLLNLKEGVTTPLEVEFMRTNLGETFLFDFNNSSVHECPIYLKIGANEPKPYADNFFEFLYKRIKDVSSN